MKRKIISTILVLVMVLSLFPMSAMAATKPTDADWKTPPIISDLKIDHDEYHVWLEAEIKTPATPYRPARHYLEVDEIGVDESVRRQGVGRKMFEEIRCIAMKKGFKRIELNMWDFNEAALKFYEAIGFSTYRRYMEMEIQ